MKTPAAKNPGPGRPKAPSRPPAMSWRPTTAEQAQKFRQLGGAKWLRKMIDKADPNEVQHAGPV